MLWLKVMAIHMVAWITLLNYMLTLQYMYI